MHTTPLRCVAVDDEPLALRVLESYIQQTPFLTLAGTFPSAVAALRALPQLPAPPDVLWLDIEMPDLNGLELARVLHRGPAGGGPRVVFTTAYQQYALAGYEVAALDYLLKPFSYEEFLRAARRAREAIQAPAAPAAEAAPPPPLPADEAIYLKVEYQLVRVPLADIRYVEGLKDYVKVYRRGESRPLLSLISLKALEERLPPGHFLRLHRSYIVGLRYVTAIGRGTVQLGPDTVPVSDSYRAALEEFIGRGR